MTGSVLGIVVLVKNVYLHKVYIMYIPSNCSVNIWRPTATNVYTIIFKD